MTPPQRRAEKGQSSDGAKIGWIGLLAVGLLSAHGQHPQIGQHWASGARRRAVRAEAAMEPAHLAPGQARAVLAQ